MSMSNVDIYQQLWKKKNSIRKISRKGTGKELERENKKKK